MHYYYFRLADKHTLEADKIRAHIKMVKKKIISF